MHYYTLTNIILGHKESKANKNLAKVFLIKIREYSQRHATRKQLSRLSDTLLDDIGISKEQALRESKKPFWK